MAQQSLVGQGLLSAEAWRSHSDTLHSVELLWTSDRPDAETFIWQHTTLTGDRYPRPRRDSNPLPANERLQTDASDRAAIGIGNIE